MDTTCIVNDCDRTDVLARGMCGAHYWRWYNNKPLEGPVLTWGRSAYDKVMARTEWEGDCLVFTGSRHRQGYGQVSVNGKSVLAHRVVIEHHLGSSDLDVLHSCDNPPCVNIDHLRYGTDQDNKMDSVIRGRHFRKLDADAVRAIRASELSNADLARQYGVDRRTVSFARNGQTWAWVT